MMSPRRQTPSYTSSWARARRAPSLYLGKTTCGDAGVRGLSMANCVDYPGEKVQVIHTICGVPRKRAKKN